jgi:hypothetical protein
MKTLFRVLLYLIAFGSFVTSGAQSLQVVKDLKSEWLVSQDGQFIPFADRKNAVQAIYFPFESGNAAYLSISSNQPVTLFVNNKLAGLGTTFRLKRDSLERVYSARDIMIAIHAQKVRASEINTVLLGNAKTDPITEGLVMREGSAFRDFAIVAMLTLMVLAIVVLRLNPKLSSDYFSIPGIFTTREIHESQVYTRIGSSTNILFYLYCSMLLAYYLMIVFHFTTAQFPIASSFYGTTFLASISEWLKLTGLLLLIFFVKIVIVFAVSYLFGIGEVAGIHFFNWVRLMLVVIGILTIVLFLYFIWHGQSTDVHAAMLKLLGWITAGWMILIFLKLAGNVNASMFHLFSYICATELIPFLFIVKVLYK